MIAYLDIMLNKQEISAFMDCECISSDRIGLFQ